MFKSTGKLIYSPISHLSDPTNWLILGADDEIGNYYMKLFEKQYIAKNNIEYSKLHKPIWGSHISVVRNEKVYKNWELDKNKLIDFYYEPGVKSNNIFYWLNVKCDYLEDLRLKLGLSRFPKYGFHLTIARKSNN